MIRVIKEIAEEIQRRKIKKYLNGKREKKKYIKEFYVIDLIYNWWIFTSLERERNFFNINKCWRFHTKRVEWKLDENFDKSQSNVGDDGSLGRNFNPLQTLTTGEQLESGD